MIRRLLFVHYDRDGVIDPHIVRLFAALAADCSDSWFIQNGDPAPDALEPVRAITGHIVVRPNRGYDFGAWGELISGQADDILACDELVLANSSCYGPLFPLAPYWEKMAGVDCDIWGMTEHQAVRGIPAHLQSYFLVIRRPVLTSEAFRRFWQDAGSRCRTMAGTVQHGEIGFSCRMREAGFRLAACIGPVDPRENLRVGICESFCVNNADWLIRRHRLPLLKVKAFERVPDTPVRRGGDILAALRQSGSDYPVKLITEHLRRTAPASWLLDLPETLLVEPETPPPPVPLKLAVMLHVYYPEMLDELLRYCGHLAADFDLIVTTPHPELAAEIEKRRPAHAISVRVISCGNRGRDVAPWLTSIPPEEHLAYDVVLKLHSKGAPNQPEAFGDEWRHWMLENLAGSESLTAAVLAAFAAEPRLGVVLPPYPPVVVMQCPEAAEGAPEDAAMAAEWLARAGLTPPVEPDRPVFSAGTMFYYRPAALAPLLEAGLTADDFPPEPLPWRGTLAHAIERLPVAVAQGRGWYFRQSVMRDLLNRSFRRYECALLYPDRTIRPALAGLKRALLHSLRIRLGRFRH